MAHTHHHGHAHAGESISNIRLAFFLNLSFTLVELVGGYWTNSVAIMSDALHDLGDSLSLGLGWYLEGVSQREATARYSYGFRRFSLLGACVNALVLLGGGLFVLSEAVGRLMKPEPSNAWGMIGFAVLGLAVNGYAASKVLRQKNMNAQMIGWHLLEDVLGWAAVLVVAVVLLFVEVNVLDPLLSMLITLYVLYNVVRNFRKTMELFLQATPASVDLAKLEAQLQSLPLVLSTHHIHLWSLDGEHHVLTSHVVVEPCATREDVLRLRRQISQWAQGLHITHTTVEIEFGEATCHLQEEHPPPDREHDCC